MRNGKNTTMTRRGFTILELLIVISIMAILATLATGAALKAIKISRTKRIDATITTLEMALMNYRAQENGWPFSLDATGIEQEDGYYWAKGKNNAVVFEKLFTSKTVYLDSSALMTAVNGRKSVKKTREDNPSLTAIPIGYPDADNPNTFKYFTVRYSPLTDTVKVMQ